mmetsp:Transcript_23864/g.66796  ORF Transcript_23864/g.66796 Transcript_23864/m.66796 type:complete len:353 (-) Transcript_23864:248-1306(-)
MAVVQRRRAPARRRRGCVKPGLLVRLRLDRRAVGRHPGLILHDVLRHPGRTEGDVHRPLARPLRVHEPPAPPARLHRGHHKPELLEWRPATRFPGEQGLQHERKHHAEQASLRHVLHLIDEQNGGRTVASGHSAAGPRDVGIGRGVAAEVVLPSEHQEREGSLRPMHWARQRHGATSIDADHGWHRVAPVLPKYRQHHLPAPGAEHDRIASLHPACAQHVVGEAGQIRRRLPILPVLRVAIVGGARTANDVDGEPRVLSQLRVDRAIDASATTRCDNANGSRRSPARRGPVVSGAGQRGDGSVALVRACARIAVVALEAVQAVLAVARDLGRTTRWCSDQMRVRAGGCTDVM